MTGTWVLIIMVNTGLYQIETMPLMVFSDFQFAYAECQVEKQNRNKTTVQKYRFECVRESGEI